MVIRKDSLTVQMRLKKELTKDLGSLYLRGRKITKMVPRIVQIMETKRAHLRYLMAIWTVPLMALKRLWKGSMTALLFPYSGL